MHDSVEVGVPGALRGSVGSRQGRRSRATPRVDFVERCVDPSRLRACAAGLAPPISNALAVVHAAPQRRSKPTSGVGRRSRGRGRRSRPAEPCVRAATVKAQAALQLADRDNAEVAWTETGYVFTMDDGRPLHPQSVSRAFDRAIAAAKLPRIRLHDLRHTHASLALAAGINPKVVSERLGHATVSITLDTYSHAIPALQEEAAERIAGLVLAGG